MLIGEHQDVPVMLEAVVLRRSGVLVFVAASRWEASWSFQPAVPAAARELTVLIDADEFRQQAFTMSL